MVLSLGDLQSDHKYDGSNAFHKCNEPDTTTELYKKETDLNVEIESILKGVKHKEMHTIEHASETIQALIMGATMPTKIEEKIKEYFVILDTEYVAVRSSATAEDSASAALAPSACTMRQQMS